MYIFSSKNKPLLSISEEELKGRDFSLFNGIKSGDEFFDKETGRKTHEDYLFEVEPGEYNLAIRQIYKDLINNEGELIDIEVATYWFKVVGDHTVKIERKKLNEDQIEDVLAKRRAEVKKYLIKQARISTNPLIQTVFTFIFNWLETDLATWIDTGDASFLINKLHTASTTQNDTIVSIFSGAPGTPSTIAQLLQLPTETQTNVIGYLKHFIK